MRVCVCVLYVLGRRYILIFYSLLFFFLNQNIAYAGYSYTRETGILSECII